MLILGSESCLCSALNESLLKTIILKQICNRLNYLVGWPSWLWRQVKATLALFPGSERSVGSNPTPIKTLSVTANSDFSFFLLVSSKLGDQTRFVGFTFAKHCALSNQLAAKMSCYRQLARFNAPSPYCFVMLSPRRYSTVSPEISTRG